MFFQNVFPECLQRTEKNLKGFCLWSEADEPVKIRFKTSHWVVRCIDEYCATLTWCHIISLSRLKYHTVHQWRRTCSQNKSLTEAHILQDSWQLSPKDSYSLPLFLKSLKCLGFSSYSYFLGCGFQSSLKHYTCLFLLWLPVISVYPIWPRIHLSQFAFFQLPLLSWNAIEQAPDLSWI